MFKLIDGQAPRRIIKIFIENQPVKAFEGDTVAIALLNAGYQSFRETPVSGSARAPLCLMGVCFDCLIELDGVANSQACMYTVRDGMHIRRQHGARAIEVK